MSDVALPQQLETCRFLQVKTNDAGEIITKFIAFVGHQGYQLGFELSFVLFLFFHIFWSPLQPIERNEQFLPYPGQ